MAKARVVQPEFAEWLAHEARRLPEYGHMDAIIALYTKIERKMKAGGITRAELARRAQLKPSYVSRIMNHPENITLRTAFRLCHALDLQLGFDMKPYPDPLYSDKRPRAKRAEKKTAPAKPARTTRKQTAAV